MGLRAKCLDNPYAEEATEDNEVKGFGGSPWCYTDYEPFRLWDNGKGDRRFAEFEKQQKRMLRRNAKSSKRSDD